MDKLGPPRRIDPYPWQIAAKFKYHEKLKDLIKQIPGAQWDPFRKVWWVPIEMQDCCKALAEKYKQTISFERMK